MTIQYIFYSFGMDWNSTAENDLTISSVQVHSFLGGPNGAAAHIQLKINGAVIADRDQLLTTTYTYYTYDATVNEDMLAGDIITFFIFGGSLSTAGGAVGSGDNWVNCVVLHRCRCSPVLSQ